MIKPHAVSQISAEKYLSFFWLCHDTYKLIEQVQTINTPHKRLSVLEMLTVELLTSSFRQLLFYEDLLPV